MAANPLLLAYLRAIAEDDQDAADAVRTAHAAKLAAEALARLALPANLREVN